MRIFKRHSGKNFKIPVNPFDTIILIDTESESLPIGIIKGLNELLDRIFEADSALQQDTIRIDEYETIYRMGKRIAENKGVQKRIGITNALQYLFCQITEYKSLLSGSNDIRRDRLSHAMIQAIYLPVSFMYLHLWLPEFGKSQLKLMSARRGYLLEVIIAALKDDPYKVTLTIDFSEKTFKLREIPIIDKSKDSKPYNIFSDPLPCKTLSKILKNVLIGTESSRFYSGPPAIQNLFNIDDHGHPANNASYFDIR